MGTSAFILMRQEKYTPEKLLGDAIVATFHADVRLYFDNYKTYKNEQFFCTTLNITDKPLGVDNNQQFIFYVDGIDNYEIYFENDEDISGLDSNLTLCQVGCIEEVYGAQELIFRFIYEYLKLNPDNYFWVADYDWVYSWEDMQKLKSLPYDPDWCYKNPKLI
ncbi:hypothetical protein [Aneurinibacillus aneurinilyticus]|jgi:hypothetical protein|uniref:hypothetical protein n=1 Tax=Aneurinibacillus aneurinilyticus TaxID=1391 RepID=UPI0023F8FA94|nr:hypothetical protein [Aneurinibacillus aneurinilyticus]MCI1694294.1 hypothetical protein [Aneurinibacillus aneurinilyticus]